MAEILKSTVNNKYYLDDIYYELINEEAKQIYREFHVFSSVLTEEQISQKQLYRIFQQVEKRVASGENAGPKVSGDAPKRGIIGSMSQKWSNLKDKIAQSTPISSFDEKFDGLQRKLLRKAGGQSGVIGKALEAYKQFGLQYPKIQSFLYYALVAVLAMSGGGLVTTAVLAGLRLVNGLLSGDRFSSAAWKAIKVGALGAAIGALGGGGGGGTVTPTDLGDVSGAGEGWAPQGTLPAATEYTVKSGDTLSQLAQKFGLSVEELRAANPSIGNVNDLAVGQELKVPASVGSSVYAGGVGTAADTARQVAAGTMPASKYGIRESKKSIIDYERMNKTFEIQESLNLPTSSYVYLTTDVGVPSIFKKITSNRLVEQEDITYDKLSLFWRKNAGEYPTTGSVDTDTVVNFLRRMGVKDGLIQQTFADLKIPLTPVDNTSIPSPDMTGNASSTASPSGTDRAEPRIPEPSASDTSTSEPSAAGASTPTSSQPGSQPSASAAQPAAATSDAEKKPSPQEMADQLKDLWDKWYKMDAMVGHGLVLDQLSSMFRSAGGRKTVFERKKTTKKKS